MSYNTKQRQIILDFLRENNGHITVSDIEKHLAFQGKKVGTATIYRYLNKLLSEGIVRKFASDEGACYQYTGDGNCLHHYHFVCNECGKLLHVECSELDSIFSHISNKHSFNIDMSQTVFCGECDECRNGGVTK